MKVKFFLSPYNSPRDCNFQFLSVSMAEGLRELGISFGGNINYWHENEGEDFLIKASDEPADIHVYDSFYFRKHGLSRNVLNPAVVNICFDYEDKLHTASLDPAFQRSFDLIFRTHYTGYLPYPDNVKPFAFGLSNRIVSRVNASMNQEVTPTTLLSYRVFHDVRKLSNDRLIPLLKDRYPIRTFESAPVEEDKMSARSYWAQTGRRHDDAFYEELNRNLLSLTFGGSFHPKPFPHGPFNTALHNLNRVLLKFVPGLRASGKNQYLVQFDSWRLWETFISNACPVHVRFEDWDMQFPVMPVEGKHYIGVHGLDFEGTAKRIQSMDPAEIQQISKQGREWALEHYSSVGMTKRVLEEIEKLKR